MRNVALFGLLLAVPVLLVLSATHESAPADEPAAPGSASTLAAQATSPRAESDTSPPLLAARDSLGRTPAVAPVSRTPQLTAASGEVASSAMVSSFAGVFSDAQARTGAEIYAAVCHSCHAPLNNHIGPVFRQSWGGATAYDLMEYLVAEMPKNDPGSLAREEYAALIAYLFRLNGMPAGPAPLAADAAILKRIRIDTIAG